MKIKNNSSLHFLNMATSSPQLELHICHILKALKKYDNCHIIYLEDNLSTSTLNPFGRSAISYNIKKRNEEIRDFFKSNINLIHTNLSLRKKDSLENINLIKSKYKKKLGILKTKYIDNELETAVYSGIASYTKISSKRELSKKWITASRKLLDSSWALFDFFMNYLSTHEINSNYCFNGRFSCSKALTLSAIILKKDYFVYDLNRGHNHYIFKNKSLHSINENTKRALDLYKKDVSLAEKTANIFFNNRRVGNFTFEKSYTKLQKKGKVDINTSKKIIAIYTSSDDEYKFIGKDWEEVKTVDQIEEIKKLCLKINKQYKIIVKMHPNQFNIPRIKMAQYKKELNKISTLLLPDSEVDSYALMDKASIVITFCSFIGPEAVYANKKLITIGPSPYMKLNIGNNVNNADEALNTIMKSNFNKEKKGSIIWSNYLMNYDDYLEGFKNHKNKLFTINGVKWPTKKASFLLLIAKSEIFLSRVNLFALLSSRSIKLIFLKLRTSLDGLVRGDHEVR